MEIDGKFNTIMSKIEFSERDGHKRIFYESPFEGDFTKLEIIEGTEPISLTKEEIAKAILKDEIINRGFRHCFKFSEGASIEASGYYEVYDGRIRLDGSRSGRYFERHFDTPEISIFEGESKIGQRPHLGIRLENYGIIFHSNEANNDIHHLNFEDIKELSAEEIKKSIFETASQRAGGEIILPGEPEDRIAISRPLDGDFININYRGTDSLIKINPKTASQEIDKIVSDLVVKRELGESITKTIEGYINAEAETVKGGNISKENIERDLDDDE